MKIEAGIFLWLTPFYLVVAAVYGFVTSWEPVGTTVLILTFFLSLMIGWYLQRVSKSIDPRPEDDLDGEIYQGAGELGVYPPWSWWPLFLTASISIAFVGLAVSWWVLGISVVLSIITLIGWVFEYSSGQHAH